MIYHQTFRTIHYLTMHSERLSSIFIFTDTPKAYGIDYFSLCRSRVPFPLIQPIEILVID